MTENEKLEAAERDGWIYFAQAGSGGSVKIGWARNPGKRLKILQTSCTSELRLLGAIPGSRKDEKALHKRFERHRRQGEWFTRIGVIGEVNMLIIEKGFLGGRCKKSRNSPEVGYKSEFGIAISGG